MSLSNGMARKLSVVTLGSMILTTPMRLSNCFGKASLAAAGAAAAEAAGAIELMLSPSSGLKREQGYLIR